MNKNNLFIPKEYDKPRFFDEIEISYLTIMGSHAYGTATELSDFDLYGFIVPPIDIIFPHLNGKILGFGKDYTPFNQYQI